MDLFVEMKNKKNKCLDNEMANFAVQEIQRLCLENMMMTLFRSSLKTR